MKGRVCQGKTWIALLLVCAMVISSFGGLQAEAATKKTVTKSGITYQVTSSSKKTATVLKAKKTIKTAAVPKTVKIGGKSYKVTAVSKNAFKNCKKLTKVTLGGNITTVGASAFYGDKKLAQIVVESKRLRKVSKQAFKGIKKTAVFYVYKSKSKSYKKLLKKSSVGWKKTMKIVIEDSGATVTKSGVTYKVTRVSKRTAKVAKAKTSVTTASIPATIKIKGKTYKVTAIAANAFKSCKKLKSVTIGKNVTAIGAKAFYGDKSLSKITIKSSSITSIGNAAFKGIKSNATFVVPSKKWTAYKTLIVNSKIGWKKTMTVKGGKSQVFTGDEDEKYSYAVTALLAPINEYFYVKTDNPDPESFRILDKDSKYSENSTLYLETTTYCDVIYENESTRRVKGGYIFYSGNTDGGTLSLQVKKEVEYSEYTHAKEDNRDWTYDSSKYEYTYYVWQDADDVNITLDTLYDIPDYLINTYAGNGTFFDKMDAVESGFQDICLYSGSYVKGKLVKEEGEYWRVSACTHIDQSFYIISPYDRKDNKYLFASSLYPFRYDSLGFPSVMATVSKRLSSSSSYKWSETSHCTILVTYGGETKSYGGQGNGEGQGLTEDKVKYTFKFDGSSGDLCGVNRGKLLDILWEYSQMDVTDDIPRKDALTWEEIAATVGEAGAWVKVVGGYAYMYKENGGTNYNADEWGVGYSIYWGGDLGYGSDTWVDGRYIGENEVFEKGEKFSDHPTSNIILLNYELPYLIDYDYDYTYNGDTNTYEIEYSNIQLGKKTQTAKFYYNSELSKWTVSDSDWYTISNMVEKGVVDQSVLDALELTSDEVSDLDLDANTNTDPEHGYKYDGTTTPGTKF